MTIKHQWLAFYTLVRCELVRMLRIAIQVLLPPVITTSLYFLIFGSVIGHRIGSIQGKPYATFIAPGLVMMSVITNAYANVSFSLFRARFQRSIEEILISPMHDYFILLGYTIGGVLRSLIIAILVYLVALFFIDIDLKHLPLTLLIVLAVAMVFSLAGFTNAILARTFDDIALVPTFILAPLTYLGGVFYSVHMLSPFWQTLCYFNPIFYMINALREAMIGDTETSMTLSISIIVGLLIGLTFLNMILLKKGIGLRE